MNPDLDDRIFAIQNLRNFLKWTAKWKRDNPYGCRFSPADFCNLGDFGDLALVDGYWFAKPECHRVAEIERDLAYLLGEVIRVDRGPGAIAPRRKIKELSLESPQPMLKESDPIGYGYRGIVCRWIDTNETATADEIDLMAEDLELRLREIRVEAGLPPIDVNDRRSATPPVMPEATGDVPSAMVMPALTMSFAAARTAPLAEGKRGRPRTEKYEGKASEFVNLFFSKGWILVDDKRHFLFEETLREMGLVMPRGIKSGSVRTAIKRDPRFKSMKAVRGAHKKQSA